MSAVYSVYTSPFHPPIPGHLPTLIVTPNGSPQNILYSYLHTNFNTENYLLTPSPQGELCVAKLFPPKSPNAATKSTAASDPGHGSGSSHRVVRCEASRNLKWTINNTGVMSPIYKLSLPSSDNAELPLFQISKPNPNAAFWSMFYFAYAGHNIPPKRIEFGKIQKIPSGQGGGGGTRISITGKTPEEKAVWQTLGEGNEDCVEWVVLCAALNLIDDEIMKAAEKNPSALGGPPRPGPVPQGGVSLRDPGPAPSSGPGSIPGSAARGPPPPQQQQQPPPQHLIQPQAGTPPQQRPPPGQGAIPPFSQQPGPGGVPRPYPPNGPQHSNGPPQHFNGPPQNINGPPPQHINGPPAHLSGPPPQGFHGQPPQGFNGQPPQGFNGQPPQGFNGQPPQGFNGQPPQGFNGQPPQGFNGQPPQGFNGPPLQGPPHFNGPNGNPPHPSQFPAGIPPQGRGGPPGNYSGSAQPRRF